MQYRKKVLFDAHPLLNNLTGVGYYTERLITSLARQNPDVEFVGYYFNFLGRKTLNPSATGSNIRYIQIRHFPGVILSVLGRKTGLQIPIELLIPQRFDLHIFPNFVSYPSIRTTPSTVVVHDLCFFDIPEYVSQKNRQFLARLTPKSVKRATFVLCVSEFTKQRVASLLKTPKDKILVTPVPPPVQKTVAQTLSSNLKKQGIHADKYILFVGTLEPRKNISCLVAAYSQLPQAIRSTNSLVLAGGKGWNDEALLATINNARTDGNNVITTGYISDPEKESLYANASCVVLPSLYEGFGMPVLEAQQYGTPVICSDIAVFHEIAAESVLYANPENSNHLAKQIVKLLQDKKLTKQLTNSGYKNLSRFSWQEVSRSVSDFLKI